MNARFGVNKFDDKDFDKMLTAFASADISKKEAIDLFVHVYGNYWKPDYAEVPVPVKLFDETSIEWEVKDEVILHPSELENMQWCGEDVQSIGQYVKHHHPDCVGFLTYDGKARAIKKWTKLRKNFHFHWDLYLFEETQ